MHSQRNSIWLKVAAWAWGAVPLRWGGGTESPSVSHWALEEGPLCPCPPQNEQNSRSLCNRQCAGVCLGTGYPVYTECSALLCQARDRGDSSLCCPSRKGEGAGGSAQWKRGQLERALLWIHGGRTERDPQWHGWRYLWVKGTDRNLRWRHASSALLSEPELSEHLWAHACLLGCFSPAQCLLGSDYSKFQCTTHPFS